MYFQPVAPNDTRATLAGCAQAILIGLLTVALFGLFGLMLSRQEQIERHNAELISQNDALQRKASDLSAALDQCHATEVRSVVTPVSIDAGLAQFAGALVGVTGLLAAFAVVLLRPLGRLDAAARVANVRRSFTEGNRVSQGGGSFA